MSEKMDQGNFGKWHDWMLEANLSYSEFKALLIIYRKAHYKTNSKVKITFTEFLKYINRASVKKTLESLENYGFIRIVGSYTFELTGETEKKIIEKELTYEEKVAKYKETYNKIDWSKKSGLIKNGFKEWIDSGIPKDFATQLLQDIEKHL